MFPTEICEILEQLLYRGGEGTGWATSGKKADEEKGNGVTLVVSGFQFFQGSYS